MFKDSKRNNWKIILKLMFLSFVILSLLVLWKWETTKGSKFFIGIITAVSFSIFYKTFLQNKKQDEPDSINSLINKPTRLVTLPKEKCKCKKTKIK